MRRRRELQKKEKNIFFFVSSFFFIWWGFHGTKNSAVYSMRGTLQYRFTTARVQWPCSTDIHWACLITQSGPARYVIVERSIAQIEVAQSGGPVTGLEALRERERFTETASFFLFFAFFFF